MSYAGTFFIYYQAVEKVILFRAEAVKECSPAWILQRTVLLL